MLDWKEQYLLCRFLVLDQSQFLLPLLVNLMVFHYDIVIYELTGAVLLLHPADVAQTGMAVLVDLGRTVVGVAHQIIIKYHSMK